MKRNLLALLPMVALVASACGGASSSGNTPNTAEQIAMTAIGHKVQGKIVWSSSREGNHNLYTMNTDGSEVSKLTSGETVDWFSRFSPSGGKIVFTRSKKGMVYERDANSSYKWDVWTIDTDGSNPQLVAKDASWGNWLSEEEIIFARQTKVFTANLSTKEETLLADSEKDKALKGADLQQPQMSPDGKFLAITMRGSQRETGVFDLSKRTWTQTGQGCQVNWHPTENRIYWVNPSGNGGSEVFSVPMSSGAPTKDFGYEEMRFIDIPGRQSHEYFPQMTPDAKWLVWAATKRGHDHDIADYDIFIWEIGSSPANATQLTFHPENDRWPHLFIPSQTHPQGPNAENPPPEETPAKKIEASETDETSTKTITAP